MRRISVYRPKQKVRGAERRLRALERWADTFKGEFPLRRAEESYVGFKMPTLDRLVDPPTTKRRYQRRALQSFFKAANHMSAARPGEFADTPIEVILFWPYLWTSEITIFFDLDYREELFSLCNQWVERMPIEKGWRELPLDFLTEADHRAYRFRNREGESEPWWESEVHVFSV
ncbi:MAG: DUF3916 domain-containing protein [Pseudomonadota bacterium]